MPPSALVDELPAPPTRSNGLHPRDSATANGVHRQPYLEPCDPDALHDMICVGFGPASLAIAIALHDALADPTASPRLAHVRGQTPKVAFLERQSRFAWHDGMLLPDARMQINFIKDLATLRNPRSEFTFLNYLHDQQRLVQFTNLGTFYPLRVEYEDYMRWCADKFNEVVRYDQEVLEVVPEVSDEPHEKVELFTIRSRDLETGHARCWKARHVVIAVGGKPKIPRSFPAAHSRVVHSSRYLKAVPSLLQDRDGQYRIAVIGNGQSAAETFGDLHSRYPNSVVRLIISNEALKPSDDSPFVNEIFDPSQVDRFYRLPGNVRAASISSCRDTNYGVVRLDLLEHLYAKMYEQRLYYASEQDWPFKILPCRRVASVETSNKGKTLRLILESAVGGGHDIASLGEEALDVDLVVVATGYDRDGHESLLRPARHLMPGGDAPGKRWTVARDYRAQVDPRKVSQSAGIWLQGCNEGTHGLSDTLLSILATRGGEVVESIFGRLETTMNGVSHANGTSNHHDA